MATVPVYDGKVGKHILHAHVSIVNKDGESFDLDTAHWRLDVKEWPDGTDYVMLMPQNPWGAYFDAVWYCPSWYCRLKRWLMGSTGKDSH